MSSKKKSPGSSEEEDAPSQEPEQDSEDGASGKQDSARYLTIEDIRAAAQFCKRFTSDGDLSEISPDEPLLQNPISQDEMEALLQNTDALEYYYTVTAGGRNPSPQELQKGRAKLLDYAPAGKISEKPIRSAEASTLVEIKNHILYTKRGIPVPERNPDAQLSSIFKTSASTTLFIRWLRRHIIRMLLEDDEYLTYKDGFKVYNALKCYIDATDILYLCTNEYEEMLPLS